MKKNILNFFSTLSIILGISSILIYLLNVTKLKYNNISLVSSKYAQTILLIGVLLILIGIIIKLIINMYKYKKKTIVKDSDFEYKKCDNCNMLIPIESYICTNCNHIVEDKPIEIKETVKDEDYIKQYYAEEDNEEIERPNIISRNIPRILLIVFIVICISFIYSLITKKEKINYKEQFRLIVENEIKTIEKIDIDKNLNNIYFTFKELDLTSDNYDNEYSFLIIDNDNKYIIIKGEGKYKDYGIEYLNIKDTITIVSNNELSIPLNNKLLIDNKDTIKIYPKNNH